MRRSGSLAVAVSLIESVCIAPLATLLSTGWSELGVVAMAPFRSLLADFIATGVVFISPLIPVSIVSATGAGASNTGAGMGADGLGFTICTRSRFTARFAPEVTFVEVATAFFAFEPVFEFFVVMRSPQVWSPELGAAPSTSRTPRK
jgi:hypothetical protein